MRINPNTSGTREGRQAAVCCGSQHGFTLIELIVVIAIVAIVTAIGVPAVSDWRNQQAVRSASQALLSHLKQARVLALSENRSVSISFTSSSYTFDADLSGSCGLCKDQTVSLGQFSDGMTVSSASTRTFTSRGTVNGGNITLATGGVSQVIVLNVIGRAYLQ